MANPVFDKAYTFLKNRGKSYIKDQPMFLSHSMALTLGVSSIAETIAICINDKIPKDEKKFLIPQELAEGIITFSLFLAFTGPFKAIFEKAVAKGKILPKSCANYSLEKIKTELKKDESELKKFQTGVAMLGSLFATLISAGAVIPITRNFAASKIRNAIVGKNTSVTNIQDSDNTCQPCRYNYKHAYASLQQLNKNKQYKSMDTFLSSTRKPLFR